MRSILFNSLIRFLLVGAVNTIVGLAVIWFSHNILGASNITANVLGYAVGVCVSFVLNKRWTFRFRGAGLTALARFMVVFGSAYVANLVTVLILIRATGLDPFLCQVLGVIPYSTLFYAGSRWYAFPVARAQFSPRHGSGSTGGRVVPPSERL
jgi:putative flippase GtrA